MGDGVGWGSPVRSGGAFTPVPTSVATLLELRPGASRTYTYTGKWDRLLNRPVRGHGDTGPWSVVYQGGW